jgi:hypothetical protein
LISVLGKEERLEVKEEHGKITRWRRKEESRGKQKMVKGKGENEEDSRKLFYE